MNMNRIEGHWKQLAGKAREGWGKLTSNGFHVRAGRREQLAGQLQVSYGVTIAEAQKQLGRTMRTQRESWFDSKK